MKMDEEKIEQFDDNYHRRQCWKLFLKEYHVNEDYKEACEKFKELFDSPCFHCASDNIKLYEDGKCVCQDCLAKYSKEIPYYPLKEVWKRFRNKKLQHLEGSNQGRIREYETKNIVYMNIRKGRRYVRYCNKKKTFYIHRLIFKLFNPETKIKGLKIDHIIPNNTYDNRLINLRVATSSQNMMNADKQKGTSSRYKGICYDNTRKKWLAYINIDNKRINLGRFETEKEAFDMRQKNAKKYHKDFAIIDTWLGNTNHEQETKSQIINEKWEVLRYREKFYENYKISNFGRLKNIITNNILSTTEEQKIIYLSKQERIRFYISNVIYYSFHPKDRWDELYEIDHIDLDPTNNYLSNLRRVTKSHNSANKIKKKNCTSKYKGVTLTINKTWNASIRCKNITGKIGLCLGKYKNEDKAGYVYNKFAELMFCENCKLNDISPVKITKYDIWFETSKIKKKFDMVKECMDKKIQVPKKKYTSNFIGVIWSRKNEKWKVKYNNIEIGYYDDEIYAAYIYNKFIELISTETQYNNISERHIKKFLNLFAVDIQLNKKFDIWRQWSLNGTGIFRIRKTNKYIGVSWHVADKKWRVRIKKNKKEYLIGEYDDELYGAYIYNIFASTISLSKKLNDISLAEITRYRTKFEKDKLLVSKLENFKD